MTTKITKTVLVLILLLTVNSSCNHPRAKSGIEEQIKKNLSTVPLTALPLDIENGGGLKIYGDWSDTVTGRLDSLKRRLAGKIFENDSCYALLYYYDLDAGEVLLRTVDKKGKLIAEMNLQSDGSGPNDKEDGMSRIKIQSRILKDRTIIQTDSFFEDHHVMKNGEMTETKSLEVTHGYFKILDNGKIRQLKSDENKIY